MPYTSSERTDLANAKPLYSARNPPYQIDYLVKNVAKHVSITKRDVHWRFGFSSRKSIRQGDTGPDCRGQEHEVVLQMSLASGKRLVFVDGVQIHCSVEGVCSTGRFECHWTMRGNHIVKIVAYATAPVLSSSGFRQFDLLIDGWSYFDMPKIYELGTTVKGGNLGYDDYTEEDEEEQETYSRPPAAPNAYRNYTIPPATPTPPINENKEENHPVSTATAATATTENVKPPPPAPAPAPAPEPVVDLLSGDMNTPLPPSTGTFNNYMSQMYGSAPTPAPAPSQAFNNYSANQASTSSYYNSNTPSSSNNNNISFRSPSSIPSFAQPPSQKTNQPSNTYTPSSSRNIYANSQQQQQQQQSFYNPRPSFSNQKPPSCINMNGNYESDDVSSVISGPSVFDPTSPPNTMFSPAQPPTWNDIMAEPMQTGSVYRASASSWTERK